MTLRVKTKKYNFLGLLHFFYLRFLFLKTIELNYWRVPLHIIDPVYANNHKHKILCQMQYENSLVNAPAQLTTTVTKNAASFEKGLIIVNQCYTSQQPMKL